MQSYPKQAPKAPPAYLDFPSLVPSASYLMQLPQGLGTMKRTSFPKSRLRCFDFMEGRKAVLTLILVTSCFKTIEFTEGIVWFHILACFKPLKETNRTSMNTSRRPHDSWQPTQDQIDLGVQTSFLCCNFLFRRLRRHVMWRTSWSWNISTQWAAPRVYRFGRLRWLFRKLSMLAIAPTTAIRNKDQLDRWNGTSI